MANNNKHTGPNVPALRFPEFSGEWEQHSLSDYLRFKNGLNPDAKRFGKGIKFISVMDILNNASISYDCVRASVAATEQEISDFEVEYGDVLFQRSSETLEDIGRSNIYVDSRHCVFGGFVIRGKKIGEYEPYFMKYRLDSPYARKSIIVKGAGAQHFNIGQDGLSKVELFFPKYEEQVKIGDLMRIIDDRINTQSKIIEEQETLLKSLADKMFLQNNFSSQLSELVNIEKGKQLNADSLSETGDYYVMNGGITPSGYYSEYNVPAGAISISEGGNSCGYVQFNEKPFWSGGHCYSLQCRTNLVDYKYIYYYLKTKEADVMALRIGSGLPNIQKKDIEKFTISYPSLQLQKQFVKALDALSGKIYTEKQLLEKYYQQKSYLLSQMFI